MTNTTKALLIAVSNAAMGLVTAFGVALTDTQQAAIYSAVNAVLALWVGLTYKNSAKRISD